MLRHHLIALSLVTVTSACDEPEYETTESNAFTAPRLPLTPPPPPQAGPEDVSGGECGSDPECECKSWGSAGSGGYMYGVCSVECVTNSDCPSQTPTCITGQCYETCNPKMNDCSQPDAICITPNGKNSICAFHA